MGRQSPKGSQPVLNDAGIDFAATYLGHCRLFSRVPRDQLVVLATQMWEQHYHRNRLIFQEGDRGDDLYLVEAGIVRITMESREGDQAILGEVHPCETFGELGLLDGAPRSATATAVAETTAFRLPGRAFHELVATDPGFRESVLVGLAGEVRRANHNVGELHFLDVRGRLASRLAALAQSVEPGRDRDVALEPRVSQSDLAAMVGATRQSVNRALADLEKEGLIEVDGRHITVNDVAGLEARGGF
jgi:CRP/FNR family transcriptional regulator, cyclic AMP receptor protein